MPQPGKTYYLRGREIDLVVKALSTLGMAYNRLPQVYPEVGWLTERRERDIDRCKALIRKLQDKQEIHDREYAPLLKEKINL